MHRAFVKLLATLVMSWSSVLIAGETTEQISARSDSRIVLFSQPFCPGCEAAKQYFSDHDIAYLEFDITDSQAARDTFERLGGRGTPFLLIGGRRINGFSVPVVEQRLGELGIEGSNQNDVQPFGRPGNTDIGRK